MKQLILALLLIATALFAGESTSKVLITLEKTPYKEALTNELVKLLKNDGVVVTIEDDHESKLKDYSAADYDVIFITNSGVKSQVRPWVKEWLKTNSEHEVKVILHTTKTKNWSEDVTVDAVSSASNKKSAPEDAKRYYNQIKAKLVSANLSK